MTSNLLAEPTVKANCCGDICVAPMPGLVPDGCCCMGVAGFAMGLPVPLCPPVDCPWTPAASRQGASTPVANAMAAKFWFIELSPLEVPRSPRTIGASFEQCRRVT